MALPHLAQRIFNTPHLIAPSKLDAIVGALGPRLGLDLPQPAPCPEAEAKTRKPAMLLPGEAHTPTGRAPQVAVIQVVGTTANRVDMLDAMSGMTSYETLGEELERLAADPSVDGILLEVDSFGGEAAGCFDASGRIAKARESKPVFGVANQYALSAGYALLSQCDQVFVPQTGEVGSIGVVTTHVDRSAEAAKAGLLVTHIHAGAHKVDRSPYRSLSEAARERLTNDLGVIYDQFVATVANGRGSSLSADAARATEALTYIGEHAVSAGLADQVGDKAAALSALFAEVEDRRMDVEAREMAAKFAAENEALKAKLAELQAAEVKRLEAEDAAYLESLSARSAEAHAPMDAAEVDEVKQLMDAGQRDFARKLGDAYLKSALAKGGTGKPAKTVGAAPSAVSDHQLAVVRGLKALKERDGYEVTLSEDGTQILSAVKKTKQKAG